MKIETPEQFNEVKRQCVEKVKFYVDLAKRKLAVDIPYPRVKFDLNNTVGGMAVYRPIDMANAVVRLNPTLLYENVEHFLEQTVGHEVGHLVTGFQTKGDAKPHGKEWQRVMWTFGLPATRCHNYDTQNVPSQIGKTTGRIHRATPVIQTEHGTMRFDGLVRVLELD